MGSFSPSYGRWLAGVACVCAATARGDDARELFFEARIRPVLVQSCQRCHGGEKMSKGLRVDSRAGLMAGGTSGPAIVAGQPDASLLIQAIRRTHDQLQMPPDKPLPSIVVDDFVAWVRDGAVWPDSGGRVADAGGAGHWAFQPVRSVPIPPSAAGASEHPVDRFIDAASRGLDLKANGPATAPALVRRLYFDLIGLPPSPPEVERFVDDFAASPDGAVRLLVDRLLESRHYGERWGRHWMDVVRYADTAGDNADYPVPELRLYRDYIIDSFHADKPYDRFIIEQLAGDILAERGPRERYAEQVTATGFLALSRHYATAPYELWHLTLEDAIDTVGRAFLGLTLRCARCHDHKFDPVTAADYYGLYGIFHSTQFPWAGGEEFHSKKTHRLGFVPLVPESEYAPLREAFQKRLGRLADDAARLDEQLKSCRDDEKPRLSERLAGLRAEQFQLQRSGLPPDVPGAYAVREGQAADACIQVRGDPGDAGPVVPRRALAFLGGTLQIPRGQSGRMQLAQWLARPEHPLTARVMVNRIWQHHFGRGLVATPSNWGTSGAPPTHPELLDYLASTFVQSGWSIKAMHRLILTSETWRRSSGGSEHNAALDPANRFYWRHDRRRLDAEAIRDALLSVAGRLDLARPGPHPFPPISEWRWTQHDPFRDRYESAHRSVYLMTQRIQRHPFLALFDGPDPNTSTDSRTSATVTPQALYLMNSPEMAAVAASLADRMLTASDDAPRRIDLAHQWCFARSATRPEIACGQQYVAEYLREMANISQPADSPEREAWTSYARVLLGSNEFVYLD